MMARASACSVGFSRRSCGDFWHVLQRSGTQPARLRERRLQETPRTPLGFILIANEITGKITSGLSQGNLSVPSLTVGVRCNGETDLKSVARSYRNRAPTVKEGTC